MSISFNKKSFIGLIVALGLFLGSFTSAKAVTFTMATSGSETDMRSVAIVNVLHQWYLILLICRLVTIRQCLIKELNLMQLVEVI